MSMQITINDYHRELVDNLACASKCKECSFFTYNNNKAGCSIMMPTEQNCLVILEVNTQPE